MLRVKVGSTSGLASLASKLRSLSSGAFRRELEKEFAEKGAEQTRKAIASGQSPYGGKWVGNAPGVRRMASTVGVSGNSIVIRHRWAALHNKGATMTGKMRFKGSKGWRRSSKVKVPARPLAPNRGMPRKWRSSYVSSAMAIVRRRLGV